MELPANFTISGEISFGGKPALISSAILITSGGHSDFRNLLVSLFPSGNRNWMRIAPSAPCTGSGATMTVLRSISSNEAEAEAEL